MTNTDSLSSLASIIAKGLGLLAERGRETGIRPTLEALFEDRYHSRHKPKDGFRDAYGLANDDGVPWAGTIAEENPPSGAYGGASIAWFPCEGGSLITFVVGTRGLAPDEGLLSPHSFRQSNKWLKKIPRWCIDTWPPGLPLTLTFAPYETGRNGSAFAGYCS